MLIFGGRTSPTQPLADTWALHLGSMHWQKLQAHGPCARYRHSAVGTQATSPCPCMLNAFSLLQGLSSMQADFLRFCKGGMSGRCIMEVYILLHPAEQHSNIQRLIYALSMCLSMWH